MTRNDWILLFIGVILFFKIFNILKRVTLFLRVKYFYLGNIYFYVFIKNICFIGRLQ